jgi:hypothetical protein
MENGTIPKPIEEAIESDGQIVFVKVVAVITARVIGLEGVWLNQSDKLHVLHWQLHELIDF